ncbi:unnamed protein product [Owenia fusiformis]|uniref:Uncharacterized protein n=1 Tax=Owenia fusiformis TaxID=6347 RepID=A0A8J1T629_OWEFU|nr:unnamed protein product [Owenia fusiformis]
MGCKSCWESFNRFRDSNFIIVTLVFLSLLTDSMLLTLVDPILPDILRKIDGITTNSTTGSASKEINADGRYGYLVASKGLAQFICNPFVGIIVTRFRYRRPMVIGNFLLMVSTIAFAFSKSYAMLFATRLIQGASSSLSAVTGMGLLASRFTDDIKRGKMMGIAIGGLSIGIIVGPVFGSVLYQYFGQAVPFLAVAGIILFTIAIQLINLKTEEERAESHELKSICKLLSDPYILIVAANVFLVNLNVSVILAFLPVQLIDLTDPPTWQLGVVVLPTSIGYLVAGIICPRTAKWIKRYITAILGMIISTGAMLGLAFSVTFVSMLIVTIFLGLALGMVSTSMQPVFALIVDRRHSSVYGNVYAISDMAVCLAFFIGPLAGGPFIFAFGYPNLLICVAFINFCLAPFSWFLRNPPIKQSDEESKLLIIHKNEDAIEKYRKGHQNKHFVKTHDGYILPEEQSWRVTSPSVYDLLREESQSSAIGSGNYLTGIERYNADYSVNLIESI